MKRVSTLVIIATALYADTIGGELNIGYYNHIPSGTLQYQGSVIELENTLKWSSQTDLFMKGYFEHPIPLIPNIKIGYSEFGHSGVGLVDRTFNFGGESYRVGTDIDSFFDLRMYDLALYYELLDNWINVDVGINVKYVDGSISIKNNTTGFLEATSFTVPIPMLYAKARFDLPTTNLSVQAEGNYVTYDGYTLYDVELGARYTFLLGLGVEAGYKSMKLKLDSIDDLSMNSDFSGIYGKIVWDF